MEKCNFKKLFALLLIGVLAVSLLSITAFAEGETAASPAALSGGCEEGTDSETAPVSGDEAMSGENENNTPAGGENKLASPAGDENENIVPGAQAGKIAEAVQDELAPFLYTQVTNFYVSAEGSDDNPGTLEKPFATLKMAAQAVNASPAGLDYTVYVMSGLSSTACARFCDRQVTLTSYGGPFTVERGDYFEPISDNAGALYNPAMIEVQSSGGAAGLTLRDIILDDCDRHMGSAFAGAKGPNNVQEAIVAASSGPCTIDIAGGAALKNFGGMSAVYVGPQARLTMNSSISGCSAAQSAKGAVWIQGAACIGGTINSINGRGIYVDGGAVDMYEGAEIRGNSGEGVYLCGSGGSFHMHGGTISANGSGVQLRESKNSGSVFVMDGGRIINNASCGLGYIGSQSGAALPSRVDLNGGEISGNGSSQLTAQVNISIASASTYSLRVHIAPGVIKDADGKGGTVSTAFGRLNLGPDYPGADFGNAKSAATEKLKALVKAFESKNAYTACGSAALWFRPAGDALQFSVPGSASLNRSNFLCAAYIPLNADGSPADNAKLTVVPLENTEPVAVSLSGLTPGQPYALMLIQPSDDGGMIQLTAETPTGGNTINYTLSYQPKNACSSIKQGDEFTVTLRLDPNLRYVEDSMALDASYARNFEQVGTARYDDETNLVTFKFRVTAKRLFSSTAVSFTLSARFDSGADVEALSTSAALEGSQAELKTNVPCVTRLKTLPRYTVAFDSGGGSPVDDRLVKQGGTVPVPVPPERYLHSFDGWYLDGERYDFESPVTADITLSAHWIQTQTPGDNESPRESAGGEAEDAASTPHNDKDLTIRPVEPLKPAPIETATEKPAPEKPVSIGMTATPLAVTGKAAPADSETASTGESARWAAPAAGLILLAVTVAVPVCFGKHGRGGAHLK